MITNELLSKIIFVLAGISSFAFCEDISRRLAWLEGDYQNNYEPDRQIAAEKIKKWEGGIPETAEVEKYLSYVSALDASGQSSEAEAKLKKFLAERDQKEGQKQGVFLLAAHYLRIKKVSLAQYFFQQLEKDKDFVWKSFLLNNLGMLALQERNRTLALDYFEKAAQATPATAAPLVNLGALYLQSHHYTKAEPLFRKAVDLDSDFEDAVLGLGSCLEGQGKFEESHKIYSGFIASHPEGLSILYNDAIILGNRLNKREEGSQLMLRYIQRGGKETARAHETMQNWR